MLSESGIGAAGGFDQDAALRRESDMLVIGRRVHQQVKIGEAVVTILSIRGNQVRLGIAAPAGVHVVRDDAHEKEAK